MNVLKTLLVALMLSWCVGCEDSPTPDAGVDSGAQTDADTITASAAAAGEIETAPTLDDVKQQVGEAAQASKQYTAEQMKQAGDALNARMQKLSVQLDQLKEQGQEISGDAKQQWQDQMVKLKEQREQLQRDLDQLSDASGNAWQDLKQGIDRALEELSTATDEAKKNFN